MILLQYQKEMQILPSPPWPKEQHHSKAAGERRGQSFGYISRMPSSCQSRVLGSSDLT